MSTSDYSDSEEEYTQEEKVKPISNPYQGQFHAYLRYEEEEEDLEGPHVLHEVPVEGRIVRVPRRYSSHPVRMLYILIVDEYTNQTCKMLTGPFPQQGECAFQF